MSSDFPTSIPSNLLPSAEPITGGFGGRPAPAQPTAQNLPASISAPLTPLPALPPLLASGPTTAHLLPMGRDVLVRQLQMSRDILEKWRDQLEQSKIPAYLQTSPPQTKDAHNAVLQVMMMELQLVSSTLQTINAGIVALLQP